MRFCVSCNRQDISSEDGEHLHTLCQTIIEEGPLVFIPLAEDNKNRKYQEEVPLYVKKWSTFKELVIVLRANLQEIVDRYCEINKTVWICSSVFIQWPEKIPDLRPNQMNEGLFFSTCVTICP